MEKAAFITAESIDTIDKDLLKQNIKVPIDCVIMTNKLNDILWNYNNKIKLFNKQINIVSNLINLTSDVSNKFEEDEILNIIIHDDNVESYINNTLNCDNEFGDDDDEEENNNIIIDENQLNTLLYDKTRCNLAFNLLNEKFIQIKNDDIINNNKKNTIVNLLVFIIEIHVENKSNGFYLNENKV